MDKAGWHTAGDLVVPENLSLVFLPPYSPELNPIEGLWLHLRDNCLQRCEPPLTVSRRGKKANRRRSNGTFQAEPVPKPETRPKCDE
jgi:transposase